MRSVAQSLRQLVITDPMEVVVPLIIFGVTFLGAWLIRRLILRGIKAWNQRTQGRAGSILYESLRGPLTIWSLMLATHFAIESSKIPERYAVYGSNILISLWILSLTLMSMRIAGDIVRLYGAQIPCAMPVTTLTQNLAQIATLILGLLILLSHFNVAIT